jgi:hypothetical protein
MDDPYTVIDDEALEAARRRMDAFQRQRGLREHADPTARIKELQAQIRSLQDSSPLCRVNSSRRRVTLSHRWFSTSIGLSKIIIIASARFP